MNFTNEKIKKIKTYDSIGKMLVVIFLLYLLLALNIGVFVYLVSSGYPDESKLEKQCLKTNTIILNKRVFKCEME
jgi:hypothetical protein